MKLIDTKDHHGAKGILHSGGQLDKWAEDIFDTASVSFGRRNLATLHAHIDNALALGGWSAEAPLHSEYQLTVRSLKLRTAFHLQAGGNASRLAYDLLKLQYLYSAGKIDAAIYGLPVRTCARELGQNLASFDRAAGELDLFEQIITCPIFLIGYSN
jgi:hypothetical protein